MFRRVAERGVSSSEAPPNVDQSPSSNHHRSESEGRHDQRRHGTEDEDDCLYIRHPRRRQQPPPRERLGPPRSPDVAGPGVLLVPGLLANLTSARELDEEIGKGHVDDRPPKRELCFLQAPYSNNESQRRARPSDRVAQDIEGFPPGTRGSERPGELSVDTVDYERDLK